MSQSAMPSCAGDLGARLKIKWKLDCPWTSGLSLRYGVPFEVEDAIPTVVSLLGHANIHMEGRVPIRVRGITDKYVTLIG